MHVALIERNVAAGVFVTGIAVGAGERTLEGGFPNTGLRGTFLDLVNGKDFVAGSTLDTAVHHNL